MPAKLRIRGSKLPQGVKVPKTATKRVRPKKVHPDREGQFLKLWEALRPSDPIPVRQFVFHPTRDWRFDFAWPDFKVAVEIDGGIYQKKATGHRSISGVKNGMEKLNEAALLGWCVLRFCCKDLDQKPAQIVGDVVRMICR